MRKKVVSILALILFLSLSGLLESKEVGDVAYSSLRQMWGGGQNQYTFSYRTGVPGYIGHAMIYFGTDEDGNDYIIHAPGIGQKVKREKRDLSVYEKYLNMGSVTKEQRRKIISFANSKIGCLYAVPYEKMLIVFKPYHPELDSERMVNTSSGKPVVQIAAPIDNEIIDQNQSSTYTIKATATDGANGSGIFKVEYYLDQVDADHLITKVYTYKDSNGIPVFLYENDTVPIELSEYKYDWDISNISSGQHTLIARTVDRAGNWSDDTLRQFKIQNAKMPEVVDCFPMGNHTTSPTTVSVTFSKEMDRTSVSVSISGVVFGLPEWTGNTVKYAILGQLADDKQYKVTISPTSKDLAGNEIIPYLGFNFSTYRSLPDIDRDGIPDIYDCAPNDPYNKNCAPKPLDSDGDKLYDWEDPFPFDPTNSGVSAGGYFNVKGLTGLNPCHIPGTNQAGWPAVKALKAEVYSIGITTLGAGVTTTPVQKSNNVFTSFVTGLGNFKITAYNKNGAELASLVVHISTKGVACLFMVQLNPDDNESVMPPEQANLDNPPSNGNVPLVIPLTGMAGRMYRLLQDKLGYDSLGLMLEFPPELLVTTNHVMVLPSGGYNGLSQSVKDNIALYVQAGGTLIVFTQQNGYQFADLPGGAVRGYGYAEDQSCHANAVYINEESAIFNDQTRVYMDASVDGYFTAWPNNAKIYLGRQKNQQPAMIEYPYGNGKVIATTLYSEFGNYMYNLSNEEKTLVNSLIKYALDPLTPLNQYLKLAQPMADLTFNVTAPSDVLIDGSDVTFVITIQNKGSSDQTLKVARDWVHTDRQDVGTFVVQANSTLNIPVIMHNIQDIQNNDFYSFNAMIYNTTDGSSIGSPAISGKMYPASVQTIISVDKTEYAPGETSIITLNLKNLLALDYAVSSKVVVTDAINSKVFEETRMTNLTANSISSEAFNFIVPSKQGFYIITVDIESNGSKVGTASVYIEVPKAELKLTTILPNSFALGSNLVNVKVDNIGKSAVNNGQIKAELKDPFSSVIFAETKTFSAGIGQSTEVAYSVNIPALKFGNYTMTVSAITEDGVIDSTVNIPCSISRKFSFDKLSYKSGENAAAILELTNTGMFNMSLSAAVTAPAMGFSRTDSMSLNKGETVSKVYNINIPLSANYGVQGVRIDLILGNTLSYIYSFSVAPPNISGSIESNGPYSYGSRITAKLENIGGSNTIYDYVIKLIDFNDVVINQASGSDTLAWGEVKRPYLDLTNSQMSGGQYVVNGIITDKKTNKKTVIQQYVAVTGLTANISVTMDKKNYLNGNTATVSTTVIPQGSITNATLETKVYRPAESIVKHPELNGITAIAVEKTTIWYGKDNGEIAKYNKATGQYQTITVPYVSGIEKCVFTVAVDSDYVWVGAAKAGLLRYEKSSGTWKKYTTNEGLSANAILSLANDGNYLWIGSSYGLNRMDKLNETFTKWYSKDGLTFDQINSVSVDGNFIWVGTILGLNRYSKINNTWEKFTTGEGLLDNWAKSIYANSSNVWIATKNGINKYDKSTSSWSALTTANGLISNVCYYVTETKDEIWIGTDKGVSVLNKAANIWKSYTTTDGVSNTNVRFIAVEDNKVWIVSASKSY